MPRYFFDLMVRGVETRDDVGRLLFDADAASARAEAVLDELTKENPGNCSVTVRDEAEVKIATKFIVRAK